MKQNSSVDELVRRLHQLTEEAAAAWHDYVRNGCQPNDFMRFLRIDNQRLEVERSIKLILEHAAARRIAHGA